MPDCNSESMKRSMDRIKRFYKNVKIKVKLINSSIFAKQNDLRPYAEVKLFDETVIGLLDTGASITAIGKDLAKKYIEQKMPYVPFYSHCKTADGQKQQIVGRFKTKIIFNNIEKPIEIYIIPSLSQSLYLGIDFWRLYNLIPNELICKTAQQQLANSEINFSTPIALDFVQSQRLQKVIDQLPSFADMGLGRTDLLSHTIDTGDAKPIKQRHYAVSPAIEKLMYAEVDRMLTMGVIEESNSPWSSPCVLVRKPGKNRLCLDSRKLNEVTTKDAYPLPLIDGLLSRLPKAKFISGLDLKDAFWQIPLDENSKLKTAFTVPGRPLYHYTVMPFGLCNAPQTMSRLMNKVVPPELRNEVFVYLDDLLIISASFERHLEVLSIIAKRLRNSKLTINVGKSKFCVNQIKYLGHVIGNGVIQTDPDKIAALMDYPIPKSIKDIRRFLGMAGWYHKFISNFASVVAPITDLLKNKNKFEWNATAQESFEKLKKLLSSAPVLHSPDFNKPFFIHCDACKTGIGSVLVQLNSDGDEIPIAFMSRKLNKAQRSYSVTEQECLAAVLSVKKFRPYIEGHEFTIVTDHASLKWLMSQKDLCCRLARWALKLQAYNFKIEHRKGKQNIVPDALSRVFHSDSIENLSELELLPSKDVGLFVDLNSSAFTSDDYKDLIAKVRLNEEKLPDVKVIDNFVYRRTDYVTGDQLHDDLIWKLWLPTEMIPEILHKAHDSRLSAHSGINKTVEKLRRYYYWPNLINDVRKYINNCNICKSTKAPNYCLRPSLQQPSVPQRIFQKLCVDFLGPYPRTRSGNIGIFVVLDYLSKFVLLKAVKKLSADVVCKFLEEEVFHCYGVPESIVSDNGIQFKSKLFKSLLRKYSIKHLCTAIYSPQANASERVNRSILSALRAYIEPDQKNWDELLSGIACALRSCIHAATRATPYYTVFGQQMITNGETYELLRKIGLASDLAINMSRPDSVTVIRQQNSENINKQFQRNERHYNLRTKNVVYTEGQEVYRRNFKPSNFEKGYNAKLAPSFIKARIRKKVGTCTYELEDLCGKYIGVYHAKDLRQ